MEPNVADRARSSQVGRLIQVPYPNQQSDEGYATRTEDGSAATSLGCNIFHGAAKPIPEIIIFRDMDPGLISVPVRGRSRKILAVERRWLHNPVALNSHGTQGKPGRSTRLAVLGA